MTITRALILSLLPGLAAAALYAPVAQANAETPDDPTEVPPPAGTTLPVTNIESIEVLADKVEGHVEPSGAQIIGAVGNARATVTGRPSQGAAPETAVILADSMIADLTARSIVARGGVRIESPRGTVAGDALEYRWEEAAGRAVEVRFRQYGLSFRAGLLELSPERLTARDVEFSTCGLEKPDFLISAHGISIVPDDRIEARGVDVALFGRRLVRVPRLSYHLGGGRAQARQALPVARPGFSQVSGFSLAQPLPLGRMWDAEIEPTTRVGIRGQAWYESGEHFFARASYRQEEGVRGRRPVLVSRLPEAGLRWRGRDSLTLTAGWYHERDTRVQEGRARMDWERPVNSRKSRTGLSLLLHGSLGAYTGGDVYANVGLDAALRSGGDDVYQTIGLRLNECDGDTPFLWDRVQVRTEAFAVKRVALRSYRAEGAVRYDLDQGRVYDAQVALARRYRCLEPEIRYSTRRQAISVGFRVFGIGSREPATGVAPVEPGGEGER